MICFISLVILFLYWIFFIYVSNSSNNMALEMQKEYLKSASCINLTIEDNIK